MKKNSSIVFSWIKRSVSFILSLVVCLILAFVWVATTSSGAKYGISWGVMFAGGESDIDGLEGSFYSGLRINNLLVTLPDTQVQLTQLALDVDWSHLWPTSSSLDKRSLAPLSEGHQPFVLIENISASSLRIDLVSSDPATTDATPISLPQLPIDLDLLSLAVNQIELYQDGTPIIDSLKQVRLRGYVRESIYSVDIESLNATFGEIGLGLKPSGVRIGLNQPHPVSATIEADLSNELEPVTAQLDVSGDLSKLLINLGLHSDRVNVSGEASVALQPTFSIEQASLQTSGFDPSQWDSSIPAARLDTHLQLRSEGEVWRGEFSLANRLQGSLDQHRLPIDHLTTQVVVNPNLDFQTQLSNVRLLLNGGGQLTGDIKLIPDQQAWLGLRLQSGLSIAGLNLIKVSSDLPRTHINGTINTVYAQQQSVVLALSDRTQLSVMSLEARLEANAQQVTLHTLRAQAGTGRLDAQGRYQFSGNQNYELTLNLHDLNPLDWLPKVAVSKANLTASAQIRGQVNPDLRASIELKFQQPSHWNALALQGQAYVRYQQARVSDVDVDLTLGSNIFKVMGAFGGVQDKLNLKIHAPEIKNIWPTWRGVATIDGFLSGQFNQPSIRADIDIQRLQIADLVRLSKAKGNVQVQPFDHPNAPIDVNLNIEGLNAIGLKQGIQQAEFLVKGTNKQHDVSLTLESTQQLYIHTEYQGAWVLKSKDNLVWETAIQALRIETPQVAARLTQPLAMSLLWPNKSRGIGFTAGETTLSLLLPRGHQARIKHDYTSWQNNELKTKGEIMGMAILPEMLDLYPESILKKLPPMAVVVDGGWDVVLGDTVKGSLFVNRSSGDFLIPQEPPVAMGLREFSIKVDARPTSKNLSDIQISSRIDGERFGQLSLDGHLYVQGHDGNLSLDQSQRSTLQTRVDLRELAWLSMFIGDTVVFGGRVNGNANLSFYQGAWTSDGQLNGSDLRMFQVDQGIRLFNGRMQVDLDGTTIRLVNLSFPAVVRVPPADRRMQAWLNSTQLGEVVALGHWNIATGTGEVNVRLNQFPLIQRADRFAASTGGIYMRIAPDLLDIQGNIVMDAGWVNPGTSRPARLSDDVIVTFPGEIKPQSKGTRLNLDLTVDFGQQFYVEGFGLDTALTGQVLLRIVDNDIRATGEIKTRDGRYRALGQELSIVRGSVLFQGALDNPSLNIIAIRQNIAVQAGLQIRGTAQNPEVRLFSNPEMSDAEKLSWLILGRGPEDGGADISFLLNVAASLMGADGAKQSIGAMLGLDELGLRNGNIRSSRGLVPENTVAGDSTASNSQLGGEFFIAGKRISETVYVSYEQALAGREGVLRVSYDIQRRLSLVARGGTVNGIELLYRFAFDD